MVAIGSTGSFRGRGKGRERCLSLASILVTHLFVIPLQSPPISNLIICFLPLTPYLHLISPSSFSSLYPSFLFSPSLMSGPSISMPPLPLSTHQHT
jgi:hypothetical protein